MSYARELGLRLGITGIETTPDEANLRARQSVVEVLMALAVMRHGPKLFSRDPGGVPVYDRAQVYLSPLSLEVML